MANRKRNTTAAPEKTFFERLGDQAAHVKEELVAGKDHLVEIAGDAFDSVRTSIQEFKDRKTSVKKARRPKKAVKKAAKTATARAAKPAAKRAASAPKRKPIKKTAKKAVSKKVVPKKSTKPVKKTAGKSRKR